VLRALAGYNGKSPSSLSGIVIYDDTSLHRSNSKRILEMGAYITISGADGSGKTTQVRLLRAYLSSRNTVCIHWFRGSHMLASLLARLLSHFRFFKGYCNPYYRVCIPRSLRGLWIHVEFWSLIPHVLTRFLLRLFCDILVCDRGLMDFIVWIVVTLDYPSFLSSIYGRFLLRLATLEDPIYLYSDIDTLALRADVPREFIVRELAVYSVLARYVAKCSIDTGRSRPVRVVAEVIRCLEKRTR